MCGLLRRWALYGEVGSYLAAEARFWQGTIHQALRDSTAAVAQFEQVVAGEVPPELACRALLEVARLRHEQSDALYEQILTQCTDEEVRGLAALMVLGRRYRQAGRGEQARRVLESIVSTQPQYMYAQLELAQLHVEAGKADEAIELIAQQIAQTPNAELTAQLGLLHQKTRRTRAGGAAVARGPAPVGGSYGRGGAGGVGLELVQDRDSTRPRGRLGRRLGRRVRWSATSSAACCRP